jgi:hypothetical protein
MATSDVDKNPLGSKKNIFTLSLQHLSRDLQLFFRANANFFVPVSWQFYFKKFAPRGKALQAGFVCRKARISSGNCYRAHYFSEHSQSKRVQARRNLFSLRSE